MRLLLALLLPAAARGAVEIFVDPAGGDDASARGPQHAPLRTLGAARATVRATLQSDHGEGEAEDVVVQLLPGRHEVSGGPLSLGAPDGGAGDRTVTWRSLDPATPAVIDGGTRVVGWAPCAAVAGALIAPLPPKIAASAPLRQLWVGGRRATRPREYVVQWQRGGDGKPPPSLILNSSVTNITSTPNASVPFSGRWLGYDFAAARPVQPSAWANPSDVEFVFRSSQPWIEPRCTVARVDASAVYLKQPCLGDLSQRERGPDKSANRPMLPPYYIENVLTNLTQPGQWYYHRANASIIYMPRPGETAASVAASAFVIRTNDFGVWAPLL